MTGTEFTRDTDYVSTRITRDGRDGLPGRAGPVPADRGPGLPLGQPGDHRAPAARPGRRDLDGAVRLRPTTSGAGPSTSTPAGSIRCSAIERLQEAYLAAFPDYSRGITVPAIVEIATGEAGHQRLRRRSPWTSRPSGPTITAPGAPDLYPEPLRDEIDEVDGVVYTDVNNGVYRCGFAGSQEAYDRAYDRLFDRLDWLSDRLADRRYLVGDTITEADVRLFTTLARFDAVYHGHFKCNRRKLTEMPVLWAYARDLFQTPGFGDTIDFVQIKQHYYIVHTDINPTQIVPRGPDLCGWLIPHGREPLGGRPFGDGTPPAPTAAPERVTAGHGAHATEAKQSLDTVSMNTGSMDLRSMDLASPNGEVHR